MSQNISAAVMQQRSEPNDSLDFFPTPAWGTRALCEYLLGLGYKLDEMTCAEPACGEGHMSRPLAEYFKLVRSTDVHNYGFGEVEDFLWPSDTGTTDWIITNPPFRLGEQFAFKAVEQCKSGAALLVRSAFLEGKARHANLFMKRRPTFVLQFVERLSMVKGRVDPKASSATAYSWIVWCKGSSKQTVFDWLEPSKHRLQKQNDYCEAAA